MSIPATERFTAQQYQVLNAWRDVVEDIRHLCEALKALPEDCPCGDSRAHLTGACACCKRVGEEKGLAPCEDCESLLARVKPVVTQLTVDTWLFFPSALEFLDLRDRQKAPVTSEGAKAPLFAAVAREAAVDAVDHRITAVIQTFEQLVTAVGDFRAGCRTSQLQAVKAVASGLLVEVERLDRAL